MLNLVHYLLKRGEFDHQTLLSQSSIDRMELPMSNLGTSSGITDCYALANYTCGYKQITFHGHNGSGMGATAALAYAPDLQSGYVVLTTGNTPAQDQVVSKIKQHLTRNRVKPSPQRIVIANTFSPLNGYYKMVNLRYPFIALVTDTFLVRKVFVEGNNFKTKPLLGGSVTSAYQRTAGEASSNIALVDGWSGLPAVAVVNDPLLGEALQVGPNLYVKESAWLFGSKLLIIFASLLVTIFMLQVGLLSTGVKNICLQIS